MQNILITYSAFADEGFQNMVYYLEEKSKDFSDIEKLEEAVVVIPYDYKNIIEPKCFQSRTKMEYPVILPITRKVQIHNLSELKKLSLLENALNAGDLFVKPTKEFISYDEYESNFAKIQWYLRRGDIYEMNYCIPFVYKNIELNPLEVFIEIAEKMQSSFMALWKYQNFFILSFSPERFLKKEKNKLYTEPIKGTAPRGNNTQEDIRNKQQLQQSLKERAENAMIVDVCRNDLSRLAQKGSVQVERLFYTRSYGTVHQMMSKVSCQLKPHKTFKEIIHATFPMASMTGAPKIRAMQIADELEILPREYYSGCLGIYFNGDFDLSVLIRSIFYDAEKKELRVWAGSAVTIYTNAYNEYQECLLKVEKILHCIENYISTKI